MVSQAAVSPARARATGSCSRSATTSIYNQWNAKGEKRFNGLENKKLSSVPNRHQSNVQQQPDRYRKEDDCDHVIPGPRQHARLNGKDCDHEIIREARVTEEG